MITEKNLLENQLNYEKLIGLVKQGKIKRIKNWNSSERENNWRHRNKYGLV